MSRMLLPLVSSTKLYFAVSNFRADVKLPQNPSVALAGRKQCTLEWAVE